MGSDNYDCTETATLLTYYGPWCMLWQIIFQPANGRSIIFQRLVNLPVCHWSRIRPTRMNHKAFEAVRFLCISPPTHMIIYMKVKHQPNFCFVGEISVDKVKSVQPTLHIACMRKTKICQLSHVYFQPRSATFCQLFALVYQNLHQNLYQNSHWRRNTKIYSNTFSDLNFASDSYFAFSVHQRGKWSLQKSIPAS